MSEDFELHWSNYYNSLESLFEDWKRQGWRDLQTLILQALIQYFSEGRLLTRYKLARFLDSPRNVVNRSVATLLRKGLLREIYGFPIPTRDGLWSAAVAEIASIGRISPESLPWVSERFLGRNSAFSHPA